MANRRHGQRGGWRNIPRCLRQAGRTFLASQGSDRIAAFYCNTAIQHKNLRDRSPAREQGYAAGLNMAGKSEAYVKMVPFNVTRLAGLTTTIIGAVGHGRDEDIVGIARGDSETWRQLPDAIVAQGGFDVNRVRLLVGEDHLIGAVVMGDQKLSVPLQRMISEKINISSIRDTLLKKDTKVADVIVDFWSHHVAAV